MEKIKFIALKTNLGYYVADSNYQPYSQWAIIDKYYFDGKQLQPTFHKQWFYIPEIPKTVEILRKGDRVNFRYELINYDLVSELIPMQLECDKVSYTDSDGDRIWKQEWCHLESLYRMVYDELEPYFESIDFEFIVLAELNIDKISDPTEFSYPIRIEKSCNDFSSYITNKNVIHQLVDKIVFPDVMLHETPASFSSKQVYDIVRYHIKKNIDMQYAEIKADYDFCFEVVKKLNLANPYYTKYEVKNSRGNSYKPPKYCKKLVSTRSPKIFEMTHAESKYQGYTVIEPMKAENELKLKEKMDKFLTDVIQMINEPLVECKYCNGTGVVLQSKIDI